MTNTKLLLMVMVLALAFVMFTSHQAWGEQDCHDGKKVLLVVCHDTVKIDGDYVPPNPSCRRVVLLVVNSGKS